MPRLLAHVDLLLSACLTGHSRWMSHARRNPPWATPSPYQNGWTGSAC